jgi:hypothetical protein
LEATNVSEGRSTRSPFQTLCAVTEPGEPGRDGVDLILCWRSILQTKDINKLGIEP